MKSRYSAYPYVIWMVIFTVGAPPVGGRLLRSPIPPAPIRWKTSLRWGYTPVLMRSIWLAAIATVLCLVIAYPLAYILSRKTRSQQRTMLMLVMLPTWMNFLLRTYAWMTFAGKKRHHQPAAGLYRPWALWDDQPRAPWCWAWCTTTALMILPCIPS